MIDSSAMLINGMLTNFTKTYRDVANRASDGRLSMVMDIDSVVATNRLHDFGYRDAAPHLDPWKSGDPIPVEGMSSVTFPGVVHKWGKRLQWLEEDREDDQTQSLMLDAAATGRSAGLLAEQLFFDIILGTTTYLPAPVLAPDGLSLFNTGTRFETVGGNVVTSFTASSAALCTTGYFNAISRLRNFKDGKGEPLWTADQIDKGAVVIVPTDDEKVWTEALKQKIGVGQVATAGTTNIFHDDNRNVTLWPTSRIASNEAYVFLRDIPVKCAFMINRRALRERSSLGDQNNSDITRTTGLEYVQWDLRQGAGANTPYGCVKLA